MAQAQERAPGERTGETVATLAPPAIVKSLLEIRRRNVVIQKWDLSCGAAALTTLLRYQHGEPVTEKLVAASLMRRPEYIEHPELIQVREGFSLLDLKRDVTARGYKGIGYGKMELKDALAKAPLLVPIEVNGYNHFVVFRGASNGSVLLADPAWGNRTMPINAFVASWINYPGFGRVGFAVQRPDGTTPPQQALVPRPDDFTFTGRSDDGS
ncbi:MAG: C39 family peptidase [Herminiimonas sp.]|nr:C39 family peptidase [Herminiimonas sp.]